MAVMFSKQGEVGILAVAEPMTAATADDFREQFLNIVRAEPGIKNYVLDLAGVTVMDSAGLGVLMAALKRISEQGGDLKIARLQKKPRMVFEITRAFKVFDIYEDVPAAVEACS